eukprot:scaffold2059_cov129-Skeletonema_dohrnii-CCMP3373.AAC.6
MFSYVAKTLLSKTLRTFLRTYLDDIELEGINWSAASTSDQNNAGNNARQGSGSTSSGWGVQLSNVKLREGMELIKLPGKRKRTVVVTKKVKRNKNDDKLQTPPSPTAAATAAVDESETPRASNRRKVKLDRKHVPFEAELPLFNEPPPPPSVQDDDIDENDNIVVTVDETAIQQSYHREHIFGDDYSDAGYLSSNPSTPKQSRSGFCGIPAAICKTNGKSNHNNVYKTQQYSTGQVSPFDDDQRSQGSKSVSFDENSIGNNNNNNDDEREYLDHPLSDFPLDDNNDDDDQDSYIEIEEECIIEDDMALVVGAGGVIGTLNIRVVDKELHITVEDAHLILEVMPKESLSEKKVSSSPSKASKPKSFERSSSTSSEADLPSATSKNDKNATIGDKVKHKSMFAKVLSMIPMLFLRDCRVTLILPEEVDSSREEDENDDVSNDSCDNCTVFELGIDFLSVTRGDDFMDVFQRNTADTPLPKPQRRGNNSASVADDSNSHSERPGQDSSHIYERRRIRTGKGPEGGLWLKIQQPNASDIVYGRKKRSNFQPHNEQKWARRRFLDSSQAFCFRCSGIDLHARFVIDKRRAADEDMKNMLSDEFEDFTMDSMLMGVDYIDPATFTRHANKQKMLIEQRTTIAASDKLAASERNVDSNGIESIPFSSNFHWMAQNCHRSGCPTSLTSLEECAWCWNACSEKPTSSTATNDTVMPLPGSVFSLSITDPIEISVDRNHLEAVGYLLSMFISTSKKPNQSKDANTQTIQNNASEEEDPHLTTSPDESFDSDSFPSYMQPDAIYISDIHILKLTIRIHALRPRPEGDFGLRFGFWELNATSICCEDQHVDSDEMQLHDATFHIGSLQCLEYKGTCEHSIVTVGHATGLPVKSPSGQNDVYVASAASQILEIPLSTAFDVGTDPSYALHARLIYRVGPKDGKQRKKQNGFVSLKTGTFDVDMDHSLIGGITSAVNETKLVLLGEKDAAATKPKKGKIAPPKKLKAKPLWLLQFATKGGNLSYQPLVKVKLPASRYHAKKGTDGFSLNTFLNGLGVEYGQSLLETPTPKSLAPISILPESIRLHILLYLDDLTPLEKVLKIKRKKKTSAFLRSHAVNKKLSKLQPAFNRKISVEDETHRRNDLLSRLQSLDVESLEALLAIHDSFSKQTKG